MPKWTLSDIPDQTGKTVVVTGANSGLGFECTKVLTQKGATVVMAVRDMYKGERARAEVLNTVPTASVDVMELDLASLASVRAFANAFKARYDHLGILLNNAGVMAVPRQCTPDDFELQFGVNYLGHFALTAHLLDVIVNTAESRIHSVSSIAHYAGHINFYDLMGEHNYTRWGAYAQSKLANIMFALELHKRLAAAGYNTLVNASHPGVVLGQLYDRSVKESGTWYEGLVYAMAPLFVSQNVHMGVLPMLYAMTSTGAKGGAFYGPHIFNMRGYPKVQRAHSEAYDAGARKRLWDASEQLTRVRFDL